MAIPDYQSIMLPLLKYARDRQEHPLREAYDDLASYFNLTDEERKELLPSGRQPTFENRVGWARTHLAKAGLLASPKRGFFKITERGEDVLGENPNHINIEYLRRFPEFVEFQTRSDKPKPPLSKTAETDQEINPEETIEKAYIGLRDELASELLNTVKSCSASFFEQLVVDLLVRMGYGGTLAELMINYDLGVSPLATYSLKRIDQGDFLEG